MARRAKQTTAGTKMIIWMVKKKKRKVEKWSLLVENQVPRDDVDTQLVPQGRLPRILVGTKSFPFIVTLFWGKQNSVPLTAIVQSFSTSCAPNLLSKTICVCGGKDGWA